MDYPTLLVFVAREAIQLVQNQKGYAVWRTVSVYGTVVLTGTVFCAQLYAEPSIAAPCDNAIVEKQMIATSTSASSLTDMSALVLTHERTGKTFELS